MDITFDPAKRLTNIQKHHVDFLDVDDVFFADDYALTREDFDHHEQRYVSVATNGLGQVLVVVYTCPDATTIRLISARRVEPAERRQYEEKR
jgi:uncharacterized DUF497 family protein